MMLRSFSAFVALGTLLGGCFEPACGPNQELSRGGPGERKLPTAICVCKEGFKFDDNVTCVKDGAAAPAPTPDADADIAADGSTPPPAGGCDPKTGLGCACTGDADCASYPADYCVIPDPADPEMNRACLYQGCDKPGKECPDLLHCCAFPFAPEKSVCLPEEFECPFG